MDPLILATLVFCHQYVGEKASINVIIYIYIATCIIAQWIHAAHYLRLKWHWKNDWKYNHALLKKPIKLIFMCLKLINN